MKLEVLGAYGGSTDTSFLTSFLVDDILALDAGCLTHTLSLERQAMLTDVLISHSHLDHTLSLPFLVDNLFEETQHPLRVWCSQTVVDALKNHVFNDVIWPDFGVLPSLENPSIVFQAIEAEETLAIGHLRITPVAVNHVVPCTAFFVESTRTGATILYTADTSNTDRVWELAKQRNNLKAIIVDCSFPNEMEELALVSGHMTPSLLAKDLAKLATDCQILIYHIKPMYQETMLAQLAEIGHANLLTDIQGKTFHF